MVTRCGMVEGLGDVTYEEEPTPFLGQPAGYAGWRPRRHREETAHEIDCAAREIVDAARSRATGILERHRRQLEDGAALLLEKGTLAEDDLHALMPAKERDDHR